MKKKKEEEESSPTNLMPSILPAMHLTKSMRMSELMSL